MIVDISDSGGPQT